MKRLSFKQTGSSSRNNMSISDVAYSGIHTTMENDVMEAERTALLFELKSTDSNMNIYSRPTKFLQCSDRRSKEIKIMDVSMNKLRLSRIKLYGREEEQKILNQCLQRVYRAGPNHTVRELVIIGGHAGTGKTALAHSLKKKYNASWNDTKCIFATGKFNFVHTGSSTDAPYSAFVAAGREICGEILQRKNNSNKDNNNDEDNNNYKFKEILTTIFQELGTEIYLLIEIIPELIEVFDEQLASDTPTTTAFAGIDFTDTRTSITQRNSSFVFEESTSFEQNQIGMLEKNRPDANKACFHYAFRLLFRLISTNFGPLVLIIDDLQWSDPESIELLDVLITDRENSIMIVGLYRSNEMNEKHIFSEMILNNPEYNGSHQQQQPMESSPFSSSQSLVNVTKIHIGNIGIKHINSLLKELLSIIDDYNGTDNHSNDNADDSDVDSGISTRNDNNNTIMNLAKICYKRTDGNCFFLIQFILMLYEEKLLVYNIGLNEWIFDINKIELETLATENVGTMLSSQMTRKLSKQIQNLLKICACLGSSFQLSLLQLIWEDTAYLHPGYYEHTTNQTNARDTNTNTPNHQEEENLSLDKLLNILLDYNYIEKVQTALSTTNTGTNHNNDYTAKRYKWVHDKIQESALSLIPTRELSTFQFQVGKILFHKLLTKETSEDSIYNNYHDINIKEEELEKHIFIVVNLLNQGLCSRCCYQNPNNNNNNGDSNHNKFLFVEEDCEHKCHKNDNYNHVNIRTITLAKLNFQAAEKAKVCSAFESVSKYAKIGISLLPNTNEKWTTYKELCINLYSIGAEAENITGNSETMHLYCNEVLNKNKSSTGDDNSEIFLSCHEKIRIYNTLITNTGSRGKSLDALNMCMDVLKNELNFKLPGKKYVQAMHAIPDLILTSKRISKLHPHDITIYNKLGCMKNIEKIDIMGLLDMLGVYCYVTGDDLLFICSTCSMIKLTLKHGISDNSPVALSMFAILLGGLMKNHEAAESCADLACVMLRKLENDNHNHNKNIHCRVLFITTFYAYTWTRPMHNNLRPLLAAYKVGLQSGDTEFAMWCSQAYIQMGFICGRSLMALEDDSRTYCPQMLELQREEAYYIALINWQLCLNLMGKSNNTTVFTGSAMDEVAIIQLMNTRDKKSAKHIMDHYHVCKLAAFIYFNEFENAAEVALAKGDEFLKKQLSSPYGMAETFYRALALYQMARCTNTSTNTTASTGNKSKNNNYYRNKHQRRKYKNAASKAHAQIKVWEKKGNPNVKHYSAVLQAELSVVNGKNKKAKKYYNAAIVLSSRGGYIHDSALFNERLAEFLLDVGEMTEATFRINQAIQLYAEWGAQAKVDMIRQKHCDLLNEADSFPSALAISFFQKDNSSHLSMSVFSDECTSAALRLE